MLSKMRSICAVILVILHVFPAIQTIYVETEVLELRDHTFILEIIEGDKTNRSSIKGVHIKSYNGRKLSTDMCETYPNLHTYHGYHLTLESVDQDALVTCKDLKIIRLSSNNIKVLASDTFNRNTLLEIIDVYDNEIDEIPVDLFKGLVNLKELYLSNNNLVYLPTEAFRDLKKLYKITLNSNPLLDLDVQGLIEYMPALTAANIEDTDIKCGKMRTIVYLFSERQIVFYIGVDRERGRTFTPSEFRGHKCLSNEQYDRELLLRQKIPDTIRKVAEMHQQMQDLIKNVTKLISLLKK